jgi:glycine cleavage system H protein
MTEVRGCQLPEDLHYWIEKHVWVRDEGDDTLRVGVTDPAQKLAARIVAVTAKRAGRVLERGQSVATIESGKWVGPVPSPVDGEVVEVNGALAANPTLVNSDPYGEGWIVRIKASAWSDQGAELLTGSDAIDAYRALLEAEGISCG